MYSLWKIVHLSILSQTFIFIFIYLYSMYVRVRKISYSAPHILSNNICSLCFSTFFILALKFMSSGSSFLVYKARCHFVFHFIQKHWFLLFLWNESSSLGWSAICLPELTCYTIPCTHMGLHKFSKKTCFSFQKYVGNPKKITQSSNKSLEAEVVQATGELMFSSVNTDWRHNLTHHQTLIRLLLAQMNLDAREDGIKHM